MKRLLRQIPVITFVGGVSLLVLIAACGVAGGCINTSASVPVGLYWIIHAPIEKGAYVMFCPPQRDAFALARERRYIDPGDCPGGYGSMLKRVWGVAGDTFSVSDDGVRVNGQRVPHSKPLAADAVGRPLPHYRRHGHRLNRSQVLLMSGVNPISYDARYFGPVDRAQIRSVVRPIFTW